MPSQRSVIAFINYVPDGDICAARKWRQTCKRQRIWDFIDRQTREFLGGKLASSDNV